MARQSDEELSLSLHNRRAEACDVPFVLFAGAKPNDCHENARKYAAEHQGCTLIEGWLIEQFVGWNYFNAHTVIELPDGSWIDPTPMDGQHPFMRHLGNEEDFQEQRRNRPQVQFVRNDITQEELAELMSQLDFSAAEPGDIDENWR
jgi:hypothetical protein